MELTSETADGDFLVFFGGGDCRKHFYIFFWGGGGLNSRHLCTFFGGVGEGS